MVCICRCRSDTLAIISKTCYLGHEYIQLMGIIGALLCFFELRAVYSNEFKLPPILKRRRLRGTILSSYAERKVKFYTNIFTICTFIALVRGVSRGSVWLCLPWFVTQSFTILGEMFIFYMRIFKCPIVKISSRNLFSSLFVLFNWCQVYFFLQQLNDYKCY